MKLRRMLLSSWLAMLVAFGLFFYLLFAMGDDSSQTAMAVDWACLGLIWPLWLAELILATQPRQSSSFSSHWVGWAPACFGDSSWNCCSLRAPK